MTVKAKPKTKAVPKKKPAASKAVDKFFEGTGRRKTSVARVRIYPGLEDKFIVNGKNFKQYFSSPSLQRLAESSLTKMKPSTSLAIEVKVGGGGIVSQAEAVRLGISRAFVKLDPENLKKLRKLGYLTRDPRMRERKKFGLKRARRAPQWKKR